MSVIGTIIASAAINAVIGIVKEYISARWVVHNIKKHGVPLDTPL